MTRYSSLVSSFVWQCIYSAAYTCSLSIDSYGYAEASTIIDTHIVPSVTVIVSHRRRHHIQGSRPRPRPEPSPPHVLSLRPEVNPGNRQSFLQGTTRSAANHKLYPDLLSLRKRLSLNLNVHYCLLRPRRVPGCRRGRCNYGVASSLLPRLRDTAS
jgi:hypothetical protein